MKLNVIIGSTIETYTQGLKFFEKIENKFKCKVTQKNYYTFETKIKNTNIEFLFAYKPKKNKDYLNSVKKWKERGRKLPPPVEEIIKKVKGDKVLFLSFYGAFTGELNEVYLPISITEKFIKKKNNDIKDFKNVKKGIEFDNILLGKIKGKKSNHITTNRLFSQEKFKNGTFELVKIAKLLSKKYDTIDMELSILVKKLKDKLPIGAIGTTSDVLDKKDLHMEQNVVKNNWDLHTKICLEAIWVLIK